MKNRWLRERQDQIMKAAARQSIVKSIVMGLLVFFSPLARKTLTHS